MTTLARTFWRSLPVLIALVLGTVPHVHGDVEPEDSGDTWVRKADSRKTASGPLAGNYRLRVLQGTEYDVEFEPTGKNRYRLTVSPNNENFVFLGEYVQKGQKLTMVKPVDARLDAFEWSVLAGGRVLVLTGENEETPTGSSYVGAVMQRQPRRTKVSTEQVSRNVRAVPSRTVPNADYLEASRKEPRTGEFVVHVLKDGTAQVRGETVNEVVLKMLLEPRADRTLIIRADARAPLKAVMRVVELGKSVKMTKFTFAAVK